MTLAPGMSLIPNKKMLSPLQAGGFEVECRAVKKLLALLLVLASAGLAYYLLLPRDPQNLILISVDTLRADHLSAYGYRRDTSPEIARRAAGAVVFEHAFAQWPKTVPSMVSMFSSTYAHTNGIMFGSRGQRVPESLTMLTEVLKDHGFVTHGITSNAVLASETSFSQGFTYYDETWLDRSRGSAHSRADHVTDFALKALNQLKGSKKFFLWIHYVDPHYQYRPPAPYDRMYVGDKYYDKSRILKVNAEDTNYYDGIAKRAYDLDHSNEWDFYIAQYDAEIHFVDDQLKRLFAELDNQGLWKNSVVVLTADHGESLGENHYFFEHGWFPYTACSNVPLMVWSPKETPRRVAQTTALLDLAPSLLRMLKIPIPTSFEGKPWDDQPRAVYVEAGEGGLNRSNFTRSMILWPYHLVYVPSPTYQNMMQKSPLELYDLEKDWAENKNLAAASPDKTKEMEKQLFKWIASAPNYVPPKGKSPDYDPQAIEQMESLGYLQ